MIRPPLLRENVEYPVLLYVYGGPNTNLIKAETPWDFMTYLASNRQYVIVMVDGRGSGQRGWSVKESLFRHLGGPEIDDQIEALRSVLTHTHTTTAHTWKE
jgi:dipeptidyl aminopeptidase/acylaminoacyl peptidase